MAQEIEVKYLKVDKDILETKLQSIGAKKVADIFFRSSSFDYPGFALDKKNSWLRLRTDGARTTLAFKQRLGVTSNKGDDLGMDEFETDVGDFEMMKTVLLKIGMVEKFSQEKKRTTWTKGNIIYDIDTWPRLDPYLEIEGPSPDAVDRAAIELGFDPGNKKICTSTQVFAMQGINDKDYIKMGFDEWVRRTS